VAQNDRTGSRPTGSAGLAERMKTAEAAAELIENRRTIHEFQPEPAPRELVMRAIEAARWAPNHHLSEPWHFYLLGRRTAEAIADLNAEMVAAARGPEAGEAKRARWRAMPGWLAVTCDRSDDEIRQREDYAACCCAVQNLSLYLWAAGVGTKWTTGAVTRSPEFYDLIWVDPECELLIGLFWYGYPTDIPRTPRKGLDQILVALP